jgi:hypothetical protein
MEGVRTGVLTVMERCTVVVQRGSNWTIANTIVRTLMNVKKIMVVAPMSAETLKVGIFASAPQAMKFQGTMCLALM